MGIIGSSIAIDEAGAALPAPSDRARSMTLLAGLPFLGVALFFADSRSLLPDNP
jgi:hypothetical protein